MNREIMFIAGEASGDDHGARVIQCLRAQAPELRVFGAGGGQMQAAGMELLLDLTEHAVVGLVEVLKNYTKFKRIFDRLLAEVGARQPAAVVLVDFPGFNLRFAKAVKQRFPGVKVIYYISPQLWAWHASRAKQIERDVDLMLAIFPFEKEWYARHAPRLRVEFVGHPLAERNHPVATRHERTVLLLPGSRDREVAKLFPILAATAERLPADVTLVTVAASEKLAGRMRHPRIRVEVGGLGDWLARATFAIAASGTVTMECAAAGCPLLVLYKVNWLTYLVGRAVIQVNWLAMPNVIANRAIVPEFIQGAATPERIAAAAREWLDEPAKRAAQQAELADVVRRLGGPGASGRAAELILAARAPAA